MIFTVIKGPLCILTVNNASDYGQIKEYINDDRKPKLEINSGTPGMLNNLTHAFPGSSPDLLHNRQKDPQKRAFLSMVRITGLTLLRLTARAESSRRPLSGRLRPWPTRQSTGLSRYTAMPSHVRVLTYYIIDRKTLKRGSFCLWCG